MMRASIIHRAKAYFSLIVLKPKTPNDKGAIIDIHARSIPGTSG